MLLLCALAAALLSGQRAAAAPAPAKLSTDLTAERVTVPWDQSLRPRTNSLPLSDGITADNTTGNEPSQIHLSIAGPDAYFVLWATGQPKVGKGQLTPNNASAVASIVRYGYGGALNETATGVAVTYDQLYNSSYAGWGPNALNYSSPLLHTVVLADLRPNTTYEYQVGDGEVFSDVLEFTTLHAPGPSYPQRILTIADWGISHNSSTTLDHIVVSAVSTPSPTLALMVGDFCYADTWFPTGQEQIPATAEEGSPNSGTYQPVWDTWQRLIAPLVQQVPMIGTPGNHEIEQQDPDGSRAFVAVQHRWPTPANNSQNSPSYFFYSVDAGPTHNIMLCNYADYTPGSPQYEWLEADLRGVDRAVTPWVTMAFHNPWYTTDTSFKEFEQMRIALEPLTYQYGVDVVYMGHVHSYERTFPVNNYTVDPCGTIHITIGDAGNQEGVSFLLDYDSSGPLEHQFEDFNGGCPNVSAAQPRPSYLLPLNPAADHFPYYERTLTFQGDGNSTGIDQPPGYCWREQPPWSAYRESSFGHGVLDVLNATTALWQWHRNQDSYAVVTDATYLIRDPVACPNKAGASARAPAPGPSGPPTVSTSNQPSAPGEVNTASAGK